jgi:hypothetical protein
MTFMQTLSCWLLEWAERFFLFAHMWQKQDGKYMPPDDYSFRRHYDYVRAHAVNAQKQLTYNPMHGGTRKDPDLC